MSDRDYIATASAALGDRHAARPAGFRWFSEQVADCLALPTDQALDALRKLIEEADADKRAGYGPAQDGINQARRKWLALYERTYRSAA